MAEGEHTGLFCSKHTSLERILQLLLDRFSFLVGHLSQQHTVKGPTDDRRRLQQGDDLRSQSGEALAYGTQNAGRKPGFHWLHRLTQAHSSLIVGEDARFKPSPQHLLSEERVALAQACQPSRERSIDRGTKRMGCEGAQVTFGERTQRESRELPETIEFSQGSFKGRAMRDLALAVGTQDKQTGVWLKTPSTFSLRWDLSERVSRS